LTITVNIAIRTTKAITTITATINKATKSTTTAHATMTVLAANYIMTHIIVLINSYRKLSL